VYIFLLYANINTVQEKSLYSKEGGEDNSKY
jgi:hypothetical protein